MNYQNIPDEVRRDGLFCLWKYEPDKDGRPTKVPYNPNRPGSHAKSTDETTFGTFDQVITAVGGFDGIGAGIFGKLGAIDIDHCIDDQGRLSPEARKVVDMMNSYSEISPSGHGIRILFWIKPEFKYDSSTFYINNQSKGIEVYIAGSTNKFVTVTGNILDDKHRHIDERTFEVLEVARQFMRRPPQKAAESVEIGVTGLSCDEIIQKAAAAANGDKFRQLWSGDTSGYQSDSEADQALCNLLVFWVGNDPDKIDELFRQSGLMRDKWDRRQSGSTYGRITIERAISGVKTIYSPGKHKSTLEPADRTDVGQAETFVAEYGHKIRYSKATSFLVYDGKRWCEDDLKAQGLAQELTARQLKEARYKLQKARAALDVLIESESQDDDAIKSASAAVKAAESFRSYVLGRRATSKIKATLTEAAPAVQIEVRELDADGYLLNTPDGTVDLRTGQIRSHDPDDFCTKITEVGPGRDGVEIWQKFIDDITVGDHDLARYLQEVAGLCAIGAVKREELIIAIGEGSNGKSTFFNLLFRVLGDYSGMLSAETLTTKTRKNKSPEYAELRGKRLIIAAELEEGERLDTSVVKKLCSTDPIMAEKKFKDPFVFVPSHHVILYTNHLPKVGTNDRGTWRRLVTVPFKARFEEGNGQIKDYAGYLFEHCAGAVITWIIDGARRVIGQEYNVVKPECVKSTLQQYQEDSDWLAAFIDARCETGIRCMDTGGRLYAAYKSYCENVGEYVRSNSDFTHALEAAGFEGKKGNRGKRYRGIRLLTYAEMQNAEMVDLAEIGRR